MKAVGQIDNHKTPLLGREKQPGAESGGGALLQHSASSPQATRMPLSDWAQGHHG